MKILIIRLSSLGDIVLTQSFAAFIRMRYPEAEIHFIAKKAFAELIGLLGCELKPIIYDKSIKAHLALKREKYDLVFDLHGKLSSYLLRLFACGKKSYVYDKQRSLRQRIVAKRSDKSIASTVTLYQSALYPLFGKVALPQPRLFPPQKELWLNLPKYQKLILIFPAAAHFTKQYPRFRELISKSPSDYYYLLAGSPSERDYCEGIRKGLENRCQNIAGEYTFGELLLIMQQADIVISADSGPMHLAAALQKPQIALFGATHPRLGFAPLNPNATVIVKNLPCQPCSLHGGKVCPLGHFKCMQELDPQEILSLI